MLTTVSQHNQSMINPGHPTLVLVDDNAGSAEMLRLLIQSETPWQPFVFKSGQEVLQRANDIAATHPALFLLDYRLPRMSGLTLYDQLHAIPALEDVPAVIFSAYLAPDVLDRVLQHGLPVLFKPFDMDDFLNLLDQYFLTSENT